MIKVNSDAEDFGNVMIMALRYALGRKTYVTLEVPQFIMKNKDLISQRVCKVMICDVNRYLEDRQMGIIADDKCDYDSWLNLSNWLYELAKEKMWNIIL